MKPSSIIQDNITVGRNNQVQYMQWTGLVQYEYRLGFEMVIATPRQAPPMPSRDNCACSPMASRQERCHLGSNYRARCGRAIRLPMAICESAMCNFCHRLSGDLQLVHTTSSRIVTRSRRQQCWICLGGRSWSELHYNALTF